MTDNKKMTSHRRFPPKSQAQPDLSDLGLNDVGKVYWNISLDGYLQQALVRGEGELTGTGALVVKSGERTARSASDKFIVREPASEDEISWGDYNRPYAAEDFEAVLARMREHLKGRDIFVQDGVASASPEHQMPIRIISTQAWQGLFARNMFFTTENDPGTFEFDPFFTVLAVPEFSGQPGPEKLNSETLILLNFNRRLVLIGGTGYSGEIKKSIFTAINYYLPRKGILTMHCSANSDKKGHTALFFGLSGTGKTTLSADPTRQLIGDDEHGWDETGIFNIEDGSYAKVIDLCQEAEPDIYQSTRQYASILENVILDSRTGKVDYADASITRNTRASYPLDCIPYAVPSRRGGHPRDILFLTFDANGVMPPAARLSQSQALYHFISGYTSKVGGTEAGVGDDPELTFSACFGAPFLVFHPAYYARLLQENITRHQTRTWMINTGLVGGPAGIGSRISIAHSRAILRAILDGRLNQVEYQIDPWFGFQVPLSCPGVPDDILDPSTSWKDQDAYRTQVQKLVFRFRENMARYQDQIPQEILAGGPVGEIQVR